jgi:hypothetical protein
MSDRTWVVIYAVIFVTVSLFVLGFTLLVLLSLLMMGVPPVIAWGLFGFAWAVGIFQMFR